MIVARFSIDVPFGKKAEFFELAKKWEKLELDLGFPKPEVLVASVGLPESHVEMNYHFESLASLEAAFANVAREPRMLAYQADMAGYVVPGSHRWDVLRVQTN